MYAVAVQLRAAFILYCLKTRNEAVDNIMMTNACLMGFVNHVFLVKQVKLLKRVNF